MSAASLNRVFSARPQSIFPTMSRLAREAGAINLGQGFPDEDGPDEILRLAADAIVEGPNQYAPVEGIPELRQAVARDNKRFYDLDIDPDTQTLIVSGATEGLAAAFLGFLSPGDEAVLLAPFYECYAPQIEAAGAVIRFVDLAPPDWRLDADALERAITDKTRLIVINTPHNPLGKVMTRAELEMVADVARRHDLIVVCDEVYEHLIFDDRQHVPLMTLPGMFERCIRIGSAGKTFSLTGFRIGYVTGPDDLI
ncbi:MAG: aminotransferase class I/II-fold pyridoxal phosphate-dependent enzyme, partial [Hyphococcus sp.]